MHVGNANLRRFSLMHMFFTFLTQVAIFSSSKLLLEFHNESHSI
jgi:hypothetical protein